MGGLRSPQFTAAKRKPRGRALVRSRLHERASHSDKSLAIFGELLADAVRRRASGNVAAFERGLDGQRLVEIVFKQRRKCFQFRDRHGRPGFARAFGFAHHLADNLVRLAERQAAANQIMRGFGRQQRGIAGGLAQARLR